MDRHAAATRVIRRPVARVAGWLLAGALGLAGCDRPVDPAANGRHSPAETRASSAGGTAASSSTTPSTPGALAAAARPNDLDPHWIVRPGRAPARHAIVYVHGLFGDIEGTWTNADGTRFFDLIDASPVGTEVDSYVFGYTSKMFGAGSLNLVEAVELLNQYLKYHGVLDRETVTLVGHSLGGLVILQSLVSNEALRRKVPLVALYASPQEGAQIAAIGDRVARNPALAQLLPADRNAFLQQLDAQFKGLKQRPFVACAYETKPLAGIMVVPWSSSTRFCSTQGLSIGDADHLQVVKPDRATHPSVVLLVNALKERVLQPPPTGPRRVDVQASFQPWPGAAPQPAPPGLELFIEEPDLQGPYAFPASGPADAIAYRHRKFLLPDAGERLYGYMTRAQTSAYVVRTGPANGPPKMRFCLKTTDAAAPAGTTIALRCAEGDGCYPLETDRLVTGCGTPARVSRARAWDWLPLPAAVAADAPREEPAPGDWIVPRLETLGTERTTPRGRAYSEVRVQVDDLRAEGADAVSFEARINGRRLWINGQPPWTHAQPFVNGLPATVVFGLENLNAAGRDRGREALEIRLLLLRDKRTIAEDRVRLPFVALRDLPRQTARSDGGRAVSWSAVYRPTAADRYQVLAYGGRSAEGAESAKRQFDAARVPGIGAGLKLVGVVRPPNRDNANWGVAVGREESNGQVRFSLARDDAVALCRRVMTEGADRLRRQGYAAPGEFRVREIALADDADGPSKPQIPCRRFSAG